MNGRKDDTDSDDEDDDEEGSSSDDERAASGDVDEGFRAELQAALGPAVVDMNKEVGILCQTEGRRFSKRIEKIVARLLRMFYEMNGVRNI